MLTGKEKVVFPKTRKKRDVTLKDVREWNKRRNYKEGCRNCRQCNDGVSYQRPYVDLNPPSKF